MKRLLSLLFCALFAVSLCGCSNKAPGGEHDFTTPISSATAANEYKPRGSYKMIIPPDGYIPENPEESETPRPAAPLPAATGAFWISGTKLVDANGNEFVMRGINHAHVWYKDELETALDGIAATGANCVRIVLADGDQWERVTPAELQRVIEECAKRKLIMIAEFHDATGKDDQVPLDNAVSCWIELKDVLNAYSDKVILNIANEWLGGWDADKWKAGYTAAIPRLREAGITNTIMVDAAGWGQYGESIKTAGKAVFDSDPDRNTMFSIHMYGTAGKDAATITAGLKGATDQDLCVIVGEFGYNHSDGDVDEAFIMKYCAENSIGYIGWSWKGNSGGVEYLDIARDWRGEALSEDWGAVLVNGENGIKATSKICSIFE